MDEMQKLLERQTLLETQKLLEERAAALAAIRDGRRSPYAAVARHELTEGRPLSIGSGPGCEVQLEGLALEQAKLRVEGSEFVLELASGESARHAPGARVELGRYVLRLSHQNFPALVVLDPQSPRLREGPSPRWFAPDPAYRVLARLQREAQPREQLVVSTRGNQRRALRLGFLEGRVLGEPVRLLALRLLEPGEGEAALSIFFRDATTGRETYPVGRYLEPKAAPGGPDDYLLDWNRAYNPACAFSPLYNCPLPPRENTLALAIRAGELDPGGH